MPLVVEMLWKRFGEQTPPNFPVSAIFPVRIGSESPENDFIGTASSKRKKTPQTRR